MEKKVQKAKVIKQKSSALGAMKTERDIAMDFATKIHQKFNNIIKATILFGSQAKNTATSGSDIDMIVIIDDAAINWDLELIAWYREELGKMIKTNDYERELHINTVKLTTWWQDLMHGDPVVINILRYGEPLIDIGGFFNPLKALLQKGKINSTAEAVYIALQRAPEHLVRSRAALLSCIEGIYWTMIDSAQAALMTAGKLPPSPEHIPGLLNTTFVDSGMLKSENITAIKEIYELHKSIAHGQRFSVKGSEIDIWHTRAEKFMLEMTRIIDILIESKK